MTEERMFPLCDGCGGSGQGEGYLGRCEKCGGSGYISPTKQLELTEEELHYVRVALEYQLGHDDYKDTYPSMWAGESAMKKVEKVLPREG